MQLECTNPSWGHWTDIRLECPLTPQLTLPEPVRRTCILSLPLPSPSFLSVGTPPSKSLTGTILPSAPFGVHATLSRRQTLVWPWQYVCEAERSLTGRSIPFSGGYPEPVISPVGVPLYVFHGALPVGEPPVEDKPVTICNLLPTGPA